MRGPVGARTRRNRRLAVRSLPEDKEVRMDPTLLDRDAFTVMGIQERFTPDTEDFSGIWKRYMTH